MAGSRIDIPVRAGAGGTIAARVHAPGPEAARRLPCPVWVVLAPGAGSSWQYWDLHPQGVPGQWSYAQSLTAGGVGAIILDTYGVGDSTYRGHGSELTSGVMALAFHEAAVVLRAELRAGTLPGCEASGEPVLVGMGHSGGGGLTVIQQANHASHDMIVVLGFPAGEFFFETHETTDDVDATMPPEEFGLLRFSGTFADFRQQFSSDVPESVIRSHMAGMLPIPPGFPELMTPGLVARAAARIEVPVFLGFGEHDIAANPGDEARFYGRSSDVTVHIQQGARHFHQMSRTRHQLADTILAWMRERARIRAAG